jgi:pimeloyl-ACP methyl ester carboxylesterase
MSPGTRCKERPVKWMTRLSVGAGAVVAGAAAATALIGARAAQVVPRDGAIASIDGADLHYVDLGAGPPIVMIHGLGAQLRNFSFALTGLLGDRHRIILVDRPGAGWSRAASGDATIAEQGRLIGDLIAQLGLDRPLVVGHSLGGAVALSLALDRPHDLAGLALIAPLVAPPRHVPAALRGPLLRSRLVRAALAHTAAVPALMLLSGRRRDLIFAPETMPAGFDVAGGLATLRRASVVAGALADIVGLADAMTALTSRYASLAVPVDILSGRGDHVLDPHEQAAALPCARLTLCDGGHMLPVTQPDLVARWIADVYARDRESDE